MPINVTFFMSLLLILLKCIYYNLQIIPTSSYRYYKNIIFDNIRGESSSFTYIDN